MPVQGGVAAAQHEAAAALVDLEEVALPPGPGEVGEARLPVEIAVIVVAQPDRHRGHRLGDHHLAHLTQDGLALCVERVRTRRAAPKAGADSRPSLRPDPGFRFSHESAPTGVRGLPATRDQP